MENYGSEIGQKMRSAVKAKLVELGTGGSAGYIDDELPDYVMIMVANKRSKQQMITDLNLFLGSQTELFVTWLHEVLQKLQEVTLPAANATTSKKRKTSQKDEATTKKDKKDNRKDKKSSGSSANKRPTLDETENTTPPPPSEADKAKHTNRNSGTVPPVINSITEVFAEELLEKAKKTLDVSASAAAQIKKGKGERATAERAHQIAQQSEHTVGFDIPTISEISSTTGGGSGVGVGGGASNAATSMATAGSSSSVISGNREKDLAELAAIQRKIYAAKKVLREIGEINENDMDSDDGDFLNLKDDGSADELNEAGDLVQKLGAKKTPRAKSPIIFDAPTTVTHATASQQQEKLCDSSDSNQQRSHSASTAPTAMPIAATATRSSAASTVADTRSDRGEKSRSDSLDRSRKRPVHERLGTKPVEQQATAVAAPTTSMAASTRERRPRQEKELYVPAFRRFGADNSGDKERDVSRSRNNNNNNRERSRDRDTRERERERDRERERERERERVRDFERSSRHDDSNKPEARFRRVPSTERHATPTSGGGGGIDTRTDKRRQTHMDEHEKSNGSEPSSTQQQRHRIGSRVIVAPVRLPEASDDEDLLDKPVNSVIKIKPRTPVSPSKQACKNLLLRAVAEAQRSTILSKPMAPKDVTAVANERGKVNSRLGQQLADNERRGKLPLNRLTRGRLKHKLDATMNSALLRRTAKNFVIEVARGEVLMASDTEDAIDIADDSQSDQETQSVDGELNADEEAEAYSYISKKSRRRESPAELLQAAARADDADLAEDVNTLNTQFVVTLNDKKSPPKYKGRKGRAARSRSRSYSPMPKVSSSSSVIRQPDAEATSTTRARPSRSRSRDRHKNHSSNSNHGIKARLTLKATSSLSPSTATRLSGGRESSHSSLTSNTPPPRRTERIEVYRKPRDIKKIIIKNDTEDEDATTTPKKGHGAKEQHGGEHNHNQQQQQQQQQQRHKATKRHAANMEQHDNEEERSTTPPLPPNMAVKHRQSANSSKQHADDESNEHNLSPQSSPAKRKRTPIKFDLDSSIKSIIRDTDDHSVGSFKRRSKSRERDLKRDDSVERRKISIRNAEARKYDNIPALSSVSLDTSASRVLKPKERCKYHPNCTKQFCEFYHPTAPCKSFPNCKYADKCMYSHPKCKYDMACTNIDCNFSHTGPRNPTQLQLTAPPLSSHVVPVQNYKSITAVPPPTAANTMCRYYPNCNKVNCTFYHPKLCRFGKNCINKLECNFYHHDMQSSSKFKWVASVV